VSGEVNLGLDAGHLRSIGQQGGDLQFIGSGGKQINDEGWELWENNADRFLTTILSRAKGQRARLSLWDVCGAEEFTSKIKKFLAIILTCSDADLSDINAGNRDVDESILLHVHFDLGPDRQRLEEGEENLEVDLSSSGKDQWVGKDRQGIDGQRFGCTVTEPILKRSNVEALC